MQGLPFFKVQNSETRSLGGHVPPPPGAPDVHRLRTHFPLSSVPEPEQTNSLMGL